MPHLICKTHGTRVQVVETVDKETEALTNVAVHRKDNTHCSTSTVSIGVKTYPVTAPYFQPTEFMHSPR